MNCFQILYIRSLNTIISVHLEKFWCCELLSDFVYSFFEHNKFKVLTTFGTVVNCFQILYIRSLNTIQSTQMHLLDGCELLSDFVYSFFEHNKRFLSLSFSCVVNCFQILYIRSLNTIQSTQMHLLDGCELLSDFVYSFFEHNKRFLSLSFSCVVNCFQILYIRSLNTIRK